MTLILFLYLNYHHDQRREGDRGIDPLGGDGQATGHARQGRRGRPSQDSGNRPRSTRSRYISLEIGKSSLIKTLRNDFDPDTKPNSLIEYWPSKVGLDKKQLVHFYEFGNPTLAALAKSFCGKDIKLNFMICLDMTQGNQLISQGTSALKQISEICKGLKVEP